MEEGVWRRVCGGGCVEEGVWMVGRAIERVVVCSCSSLFASGLPEPPPILPQLKELVARIDAKLHAHMMGEGLHFIQFAFRWMNCLLMRVCP